ncbi:NADH-quinone oxidoreductase subunit J [Reichenbachiella agarivorans]|uniref:NADH-quinone oxidoreductase subunit J n=1 Tax=Reichenbachiella agarivorans TaxID=2979464 RepID=A0ABY6CJI1_9BACT|nr:NADH-quinone oxidoreductase subunit J [Reichenbachiella agarivorans]UXP30681.1 NADH-quinone oxidoreductase subunit J [Reichenbachiella agarivorans]
MDFNILAFYGFAGMAVISAVMILLSKNIIHSVFMLVLVFFSIAGVFLISNAEFVGVTQIMVYIGGVLILMMFGVMLTNRIDGSKLVTEHRRVIPALLVGVGLILVFAASLKHKFPLADFGPVSELNYSVTETIGINLMTHQLVALELTAVLLLMALIGAAYLAGSKFEEKK